MSTDHQQYSTENQRTAIQRFAEARGLVIVRSFVDSGKSGVGIQGRDVLQDLLRVVESGQADFSTILVYDVSRWGRFQEPDEGAYYEFRCIRSSITVQYCAEQFPTDNAPMSAVLKSLKRAMAGEYSRELSAKVFAGQCRLVTLGFRQGGTPGYGLRRAYCWISMVSPRRYSNVGAQELSTRTCHPYTRARVRGRNGASSLSPFHSRPSNGIANRDASERRGSPGRDGETLDPQHDREVLTNEKYIGNNLYNRTSAKLQRPSVANKPTDWVRCSGAYTAIVEADVFTAVRQIINERDRRHTDEELLSMLRELLNRLGTLSGIIINETDGMPSAATYGTRFGSLRRAYELVGYTPARDYSYLAINRALRAFHDEQVTAIVTQATAAGAHVRHDRERDLLTINDEFTASVSISRCRELRNGDYRWLLRFDTSLDPDITIGARMAPGNSTILDYYLFPSIDVLADHCRLCPENGVVLDVYRFTDLALVVNLSRPTSLPEAA